MHKRWVKPRPSSCSHPQHARRGADEVRCRHTGWPGADRSRAGAILRAATRERRSALGARGNAPRRRRYSGYRARTVSRGMAAAGRRVRPSKPGKYVTLARDSAGWRHVWSIFNRDSVPRRQSAAASPRLLVGDSVVRRLALARNRARRGRAARRSVNSRPAVGGRAAGGT